LLSSEFPWEAHVPSEQDTESTSEEPALLSHAPLPDNAQRPWRLEGRPTSSEQEHHEVEGT
jgi:hypothetical protein